MSFLSEDEFMKWKVEEEDKNNVMFGRAYFHNLKDYVRTVFTCHRSGTPYIKTTRKRQMKVAGSKKHDICYLPRKNCSSNSSKI